MKFDNNGIPLWRKIDPPYYWVQYDLFVISDRTLPNGQRQHVVRGGVPDGTVINNAQIFSEDVLTGVEFQDSV